MSIAAAMGRPSANARAHYRGYTHETWRISLPAKRFAGSRSSQATRSGGDLPLFALGQGFAFLGSPVSLEVGGEDFYLEIKNILSKGLDLGEGKVEREVCESCGRSLLRVILSE
ncbi:MAG: DUF1016 domain-containing protein [bacterium]|nr:DUF1016 domain-containing protein [bacterium]